MLSCLGCTLDPITRSASPRTSSGRRPLDPREALQLLSRCRTTIHLRQAHAHLLRSSLADDPTLLLTALLRHYSSHRNFHHAALIFSQFPDQPPTFAWNLMIRVHTLNGAPLDALLLYNSMALRGVPPDKFTFPFAIKACSSCSELGKGREIQGRAIKTGFYKDTFLHNTLVHLYLSCGHSVCGRRVFDRMRVRNVVSWTTLVSGLVACGELQAARSTFEAMPARNVVSWTAMIVGYARNGQPDEAFELFRRMRTENGVRPNEFTLVGLLISCTEVGSLKLGRRIHDLARRNGEVGRGPSPFVGTALIDMYSKCGSLRDAIRVFGQMPVKSLATWNSMITSLGVHGRGREAVALFGEMERTSNVRPDEVTFVGVLCACARAGMVSEGCRFFGHMVRRYGITPVDEHYRCMGELLGHPIKLDENGMGPVSCAHDRAD